MLVHAAALFRQALALDAVENLDHGMRRETRPDAGDRVRFRPGEEIHQPLPVGLVGQARGARLGARHDQRIGGLGEELVDRPVGAGEVLEGLGRSRQLREGRKAQLHRLGARGGLQQAAKLRFRGLQRAVGHVVDEADENRAPAGGGGRARRAAGGPSGSRMRLNLQRHNISLIGQRLL